MSYSKTNTLLGLPLMRGGIPELHGVLRRAVKAEQPQVIAHLNLHALYLSRKNSWMGMFLQQACFVYCDGEAVRWAAKILGLDVPEKIGLTRWVWDLAGLCEKEGLSLFLLGGRPGIAAAAAQNLQSRYPGLQIAGTQDGYFDHHGPENEQLIEKLKKIQPDVTIVAFGMPLQEAWLRDYLPRFNRGVFIPGGGVLDYVSGRLGKAPAWMIRFHLEWLFRVCQEPQRLFKRYLIEIPWFFWVVAQEKLKELFSS